MGRSAGPPAQPQPSALLKCGAKRRNVYGIGTKKSLWRNKFCLSVCVCLFAPGTQAWVVRLGCFDHQSTRLDEIKARIDDVTNYRKLISGSHLPEVGPKTTRIWLTTSAWVIHLDCFDHKSTCLMEASRITGLGTGNGQEVNCPEIHAEYPHASENFSAKPNKEMHCYSDPLTRSAALRR